MSRPPSRGCPKISASLPLTEEHTQLESCATPRLLSLSLSLSRQMSPTLFMLECPFPFLTTLLSLIVRSSCTLRPCDSKILDHRASEYSCPAKQRRNSPRKGAEKSGRRGQSKDETRRGGRQGSIGRERRVRQAKGCTAQGGSFSNQKTFGVSQPFISIDREPQQRGREGGIEGFRHAIVRLRGLI